MEYEEKADNRKVGRWIDLTGECLLGSPGQTVSCAVRFGVSASPWYNPVVDHSL